VKSVQGLLICHRRMFEQGRGQGMALTGQLPWTAWSQQLGRRRESRSAQDTLTPQLLGIGPGRLPEWSYYWTLYKLAEVRHCPWQQEQQLCSPKVYSATDLVQASYSCLNAGKYLNGDRNSWCPEKYWASRSAEADYSGSYLLQDDLHGQTETPLVAEK